jgi:hypothetical protein
VMPKDNADLICDACDICSSNRTCGITGAEFLSALVGCVPPVSCDL